MGWYDRSPRDLDHAFAVALSDIEAYLQAVIPTEQPAALLVDWWAPGSHGSTRVPSKAGGDCRRWVGPVRPTWFDHPSRKRQ